MGPQMFKDTLYGDAETNWLTIFYPSRQTVLFPAPVPDLDFRRQRPDNDRARGKTDDIIAIPGQLDRPRLRQPRRLQGAASLAPNKRMQRPTSLPSSCTPGTASRSTGCSRNSPASTPGTTERHSGAGHERHSGAGQSHFELPLPILAASTLHRDCKEVVSA